MSDIDVKQHTRTYIGVFVALGILTVVTVTVSYFHFVLPLAIAVALLIAAVKSSMVASFFMHLAHEKRVIYLALMITLVFFIALMFLPLLGYLDQVKVR